MTAARPTRLNPSASVADVATEVAAQDIPGQVSDAVTAADIPGQVSTVVASDPSLIDAAATKAASGAGLLTAAKAPALNVNRVVNPQCKGGPVDNGGPTLFTLSETTSGLPTGFSYGAQSVRKGTNSSSVALVSFGAIAAANASAIPVSAGETISASIRVWSADPASKVVTVFFTFYNSSDAKVSDSFGPTQALASSTWETHKVEGKVVPAGATHATVVVAVETASGVSTTGSVTKTTGAMLQTGATVDSTYSDGQSPEWEWKGTAHASQSVKVWRTVAEQDAVLDNIYTDTLVGKNLYNPADPGVLTNFYISSTPDYNSLTGWRVTGWIPVTPGVDITASAHLHAVFADSSFTWISPGALNVSGGAPHTYTPPGGAAYARFDFEYDTDPNFQVELGTVATAFEPYYEYFELTDPMAKAIRREADPAALPLSITIVNGELAVTSTVGGAPLVTYVGLAASSNGSVRFSGTYFNGVQIADDTDDVCPIVTQLGYVGANHGYLDPVAAFTNPDSKTTADIGSIWHDTGGRQYVLLGFTTDSPPKLIMGGSYTGGTSTPCTVAAVNPTTNLTHVSGATHTGAINYTTKVTTAQLLPSVGRIHVTAWLDGVQISANDTYTGSVLEVRESYEVLDYKALYDYAVANNAVAANSIAGCVLVSNTFRWNGSGRCRVTTTYDELTPTTLGQAGVGVGAVQALNLSASGKTTKRYVPGMGTVNGHDWSAGIDLTSYSSDDTLDAASARVAGRIPAFHLDTLDTSGTLLCGFACGFLPFGSRSDTASRSAQRASHASSALWFLKGTKKAYPYFTTSEAAGWGHLQMDAYRIYLSPSQVTSVLVNKTDALTAYAALNQVAGVE